MFGSKIRTLFLLLGCPFQGGKTRGSGTEKRCAHKWFYTIFPFMDPCTNIFCTLSPHSSPPPRNPNPNPIFCTLSPHSSPPETQKALRIEKANNLRCSKRFNPRSQLVMFALGSSEKCPRCIQTHTPFTVGSH